MITRKKCLFTDGICEARNSDGEMFGTERIARLVRHYSSASAKEIMLSILDSVEEFCGQAALQDDLTLVVVKSDAAAGRIDPAACFDSTPA
jgi:sigma-B regulation protein RsbU (phosphoserine phosphatase)